MLKELIAKVSSGTNTLEKTAARLNLADYLMENAEAIAELIEAARERECAKEGLRQWMDYHAQIAVSRADERIRKALEGL